MDPELITKAQQDKGREQLKLLSVFHFVLGAFCLLGVPFLVLHYVMMRSFFSNPEAWTGKNGPAPPQEFFEMFVWFYLFLGVVFLAVFVANIVSGVFMLKRKHRMFSLIVAGLDCLWIPFGTILGVFTLIVLMRESAGQLYEV